MLHPKAKNSLLYLAITSAYGCLVVPAQAQEATTTVKPSVSVASDTSTSTDKKSATNKDQVQEVIVTATRHSTSLLKTPIAMTAITQDNLTSQGVVDVRGLSGQVPNLQIAKSNDGSSGVQMSIRGVTSSDFTEIGNPAVGLHIDGLYSPRPQAAMGLLFDLDRLEVLRGPQGTLFGRNSTGGSINIIPAKPEFGGWGGNGVVDLGNYHRRQVSAAQNIPVNDVLAFRATMMAVKRDGYLNQTQDTYAANFPALGIIPAKDAKGKIIPDTDQRHNRKLSPDKYYTNMDEAAFRLQSRLKVTPDVDWRLTYENYRNKGAGDLPLKDCAQAKGTPYACKGGQWDVSVNVPGEIDMTINSLRSGLVWNPSNSVAVEYNASYSNQQRREIQDSDSGYQPIEADVALRLGTSPFNDIQTFTHASKYVTTVHELQLRHQLGKLRYVAGLFWMHEKNAIDFGQDYLATTWGQHGFPAYSGYYHQTDRQSDSKAIFAQADWEFSPSWNLTTGARMTKDTRADKNGLYWDNGFSPTGDPAIYFKGQFNPGEHGTPGFMPYNSSHLKPGMGSYYGEAGFDPSIKPQVSNASGSWKKSTWRLGLTKQLTPSDMVFTSLSTGYKAGGMSDIQDICRTGLNGNCQDMTPGPHFTTMPYKPETLSNLEFGYKGKLLDNRLTLSATAFFSRYTDMQITGMMNAAKVVPKVPCTVDNPYCDVVSIWGTYNAAKSSISGIEVEGEVRPWHGAHLGYSYSYLKAEVDSYPTYSEDNSISCDPKMRADNKAPQCKAYTGNNLLGNAFFPLDIRGNRLPYTPKHTVNLNFAQDIAIGGDYTLIPMLAVRWQDKMYFSLRNLDNRHISDAQKAYATVDTGLKLLAPNDKWYLEAYVRNLTDTVAKNYGSVVSPGYVTASYNDPRMFGIRFGATW